MRSKHVKLKEYGPGPCVQQEGVARGGVGTPRALQAAPSSQSPLVSRSHPGGLAPKGPEQASPLPAQPYLLGPTKCPNCHALPHGPDVHTNHDNSPVCAKASNLPKATVRCHSCRDRGGPTNPHPDMSGHLSLSAKRVVKNPRNQGPSHWLCSSHEDPTPPHPKPTSTRTPRPLDQPRLGPAPPLQQATGRQGPFPWQGGNKRQDMGSNPNALLFIQTRVKLVSGDALKPCTQEVG